jgi:ABC-2 type transport system permease protein
MLSDDLRGVWAITLKDLRAYYFKPPNISWGILFPFAFVLAFMIRGLAARGLAAPDMVPPGVASSEIAGLGISAGDLGELGGLVPGLLALTLLFGATSMEAIVITFERRIGALERLLLAPMRLQALLAGKVLGGMVFGLATTAVVLSIALLVFGAAGVNWSLLVGAALLSAAAFSALGALISVSVKEVFEAQTLANAFRFPMMFLGGVFVPLALLPTWLQVVARFLPLTYAVEALGVAMTGGDPFRALIDLLVLTFFTAVFFGFASRMLAYQVA